MDKKPTPWAPAHLNPVFCCCHHWDAWECSKSRDQVTGEIFGDEDDRCDCCCHDRNIDDDDEI